MLLELCTPGAGSAPQLLHTRARDSLFSTWDEILRVSQETGENQPQPSCWRRYTRRQISAAALRAPSKATGERRHKSTDSIYLGQCAINYQNRNLTKHRDLKRQKEAESREAAEDHGHPACGLILHIPPSSQLSEPLTQSPIYSCGFSRNMNPKTRCTGSSVHGIKASIRHVSSVSPIYSFCLLLSSDYNLLINNTLLIFSITIYFLSH